MKQVVSVPNILMPNKDIDMSKWAVVACDQYTSEPEYWKELSKLVKGSESTLDIVLPEIYLTSDTTKMVEQINGNMARFINEKVFTDIGKCFVLVDRSTPYTKRRLGLMLAIDLEQYSFVHSDKALIRATEGTVIERIPPRVKIRQNASIESPHIMLLIDDIHKTVIEPLYNMREKLNKIYDFELNMNGGHIKGYKITDTEPVINALNNLINPQVLKEKYNSTDAILFAVGDGNHSLATARQCWFNIKDSLQPSEQLTHPARFALVEVVNLYDEGLMFEPIHRAVFNVDTADFIKGLTAACCGNYKAQIISDGKLSQLNLDANAALAVKQVQDYIDNYLSKHKEATVDYIHGIDALKKVCKEKNSVGITLPAPIKTDLFKYVLQHGAYPRKTFSMGEANEKRYYLECRKIK